MSLCQTPRIKLSSPTMLRNIGTGNISQICFFWTMVIEDTIRLFEIYVVLLPVEIFIEIECFRVPTAATVSPPPICWKLIYPSVGHMAFKLSDILHPGETY